MEKRAHIIIAGVGHLSFQVHRKLKEKGFAPVQVACTLEDKITVASNEHSIYEQYKKVFLEAGIASAEVVYLLDDDDSFNIEFFLIVAALNPNAKLIVSLFNDTLAKHLRTGHKSMVVFNPAAIAAVEFAKVVRAARGKPHEKTESDIPELQSKPNTFLFNALFYLTLVFGMLWATATYIIHSVNSIAWIDAFYLTSTILTTTGMGDLTLISSSVPLKLLAILLMVAGVTFIPLTFSLIVEWLLLRRAELVLGRKKYSWKGHYVICGLGRLGYHVALELLKLKYKVLIVEQDAENKFIHHIRHSGAHVFIADARLLHNLQQANVMHARSVLSLIQNDLKNLEIGLIVRSLQPKVPVVMRIFDADIAEQLRKRLHIPAALSASSIVANYLLKKY